MTEAKEKQEKRPKTKGTKRRNFWIFGLGGVFGLLLAGFMANSADVIDLKSLTDMNLDSLIDVLPAGLIRDAQAMQVRLALLSMASRGWMADAKMMKKEAYTILSTTLEK